MKKTNNLPDDTVQKGKSENVLSPDDTLLKNENYTPYGKEWEKEMMKLPKKTIISMYKDAQINLDELFKTL